MAVDIGRTNYQAYAKYVSENSKEKFVMVKWEQLSRVEMDGWRHSAVAVLQQIDKEREDSEEGLIG